MADINDASPVERGGPARKRWLRRFLELLLLVALLLLVHVYQTWGVVRGPAPDFEGRLLDGTPVSLAQFRGRPLLLQFWATWCPVCRLEQDSIESISKDHALLSVALEQMSPDGIAAWMTERGLDYPVVPDPAGVVAEKYGVRGVPASIIIDPQGQIRFVEVGYTTEAGLRLRLWWAGL